MAVKEIKDMGASVLARLKKQAKETGINYQTCLQLFAQEEFLRKLEMSRYAENLVLKGGMFLYTISNYEGRPTMDIDFMLRRMSNEVAGMETIMEEICQTETYNDFITMEVLGKREITPEKKYPGIGINLMAHIKNVKIPFSVDIGVDDVIIPGAVKRTVTTRLEGFKEPNIYTYSLESTMAEKFDAILKRMTASSRMKDFYDIYLIYKFTFERLNKDRFRNAVKKTFSYRAFNDDLYDCFVIIEHSSILQRKWNAYVRKNKYARNITFSDTICCLKKYIDLLVPIRA